MPSPWGEEGEECDYMDRTFRGLTAGITAGIVMNAWNLVDYYYLHISRLRFLDWSAVLLTLNRPKTTAETLTFLVISVLWDGFLGSVFAHLILKITSYGIIVKSTIFSLMLWFVFKVIVNLFMVPVLSSQLSFAGRLSNLFGVILWGIVLGFVMRQFEAPQERKGSILSSE